MRVFPDTSVLFPVRLINLIMRSHAAGIIEVVWSDDLLVEFERVMIEKQGIEPTRAAGVVERIRRYAPDGRIDRDRYSNRVALMRGPDVDDHVHAAAASAAADVLLTHNVSDFAEDDVAPCRVSTPASLFAELAEHYSLEFARILTETSVELIRPQRSPRELLDDLAAIGLVGFADLVAEHLD